jgi:putative transcriptional regulator
MIETAPRKRRRSARNGYLDGQFLIAMPAMSDKRFARSVIYMCLHNSDGAMGLIINQRATNVSFSHLLRELGVLGKDTTEEEFPAHVLELTVQIGGPVKTEHGFVLHTPDYTTDSSTLEIDNSVRLSNTVDILKAIALGKGPSRARSRPTAGCPVRRTRISCSIPISS